MQARSLRLQIASTVAVVFVSFMLRSVFSAANAITGFAPINASYTSNITCVRALFLCIRAFTQRHSAAVDICNASCQPEGVIINVWMFYTPELQFAVVFLSSPVTLLVALWGMTSSQARTLLNIGGGSGGADAARNGLVDRMIPAAERLSITMQATR